MCFFSIYIFGNCYKIFIFHTENVLLILEEKRTKCVKIIFISVKEITTILYRDKNNVTRRSKALLTKCTIFHKKHYGSFYYK
jgi:hypothetical protein